MHLIDTSALAQSQQNERARQALARLAAATPIATCAVAAMETLYSARSNADYSRIQIRLKSFEWLESGETQARRAMEVQSKLARRGGHRIPVTDLLIAASAELGGAVLLHYDKHFDLIAEVTGQPTRWIVPRGRGH